MQIMEQIRGAIMVGEFPPGGRIPPVRDFAAQAQVNPNTMQRALLELEREGLLVTDGTIGRYVTQDRAVLETMRKTATDAIFRAAAAQFKALGLSMEEACRYLMQLEQEEQNG